ncbi:MarR family winged helix-turn-helix transcriptional regulator [Methylobacterium sp. J-092]|uniref:MarR family winged helix-turn-helix transcriptional regulator n=1 Tax=Methylobacterium sp. J-092 TaxID=2836667 RepID=UPI001FB945F8|nr:MarR family winged helix-turn-helix transcriptional regulator [Methylobacterium sp. J-092]MCJ2007876.1 MarR family winged helix-turn-helix transcriptional regulator [Methylobacterium sp. J-092]
MSAADEIPAAAPVIENPGLPVNGKAKNRKDGRPSHDAARIKRKGRDASAERPGEVPAPSPETAAAKRPGSKPPGAKSVGWALVQAARLHRARIGDRLAMLDLFAGQEQVVQVLAASGTMTMGDLAATLRVRPPTASKTISRLAALGFVERRAEAGDGRIVRVRLTEAGLAKAEAIEGIWDAVEAELLAGLDNKERRRLRKLLRKAAKGLAEAGGLTGHETEADAEIEADEDEADALAPIPAH